MIQTRVSNMNGEKKKAEIREKVEAADARQTGRERGLGQQAAHARDQVTDFVREHPLLTVAGGLAAGVAISALFPRSPTRKVGGKAASLLMMGAQLGLDYAQKAQEAAGEAGRRGMERAEEIGDTLSGEAKRIGGSLSGEGARFAEVISEEVARFGEMISASASRIGDAINQETGKVRDRVHSRARH